MIDVKFCASSYLALRYVEKENMHFSNKYLYRHPQLPCDDNRQLVMTSEDIGCAIKKQIEEAYSKYKRIGILLSGGMDSSILASYLRGADAYTFRFLGGEYQKEELARAETYASINNMTLHYVDIGWNTVEEYLDKVMISKGGPVHSIEPQICQAAIQAKRDGIDLMIIGDASDYIFGGMDKLLSKDWSYEEFVKRYFYIDPFEVLKEAVNVEYVFNKYRSGDKIDFIEVIDKLAAQESYGSYDNAFIAAKMEYLDPYESLKMAYPLDLTLIRNGKSKYLIRDLFAIRYPELSVPEKLPMPRLVDFYFANWNGPTRPEFRCDIDISRYSGNQRWLLWCLEKFLDLVEM